MTSNETIKFAINVLGKGRPGDYVISPTSHAAEFKERSPDLAAILDSPAVMTTAQEYEEKDKDALEAQKRFKRLFNRSNLAVLTTGIFVALFMATAAAASVMPEWVKDTLFVVFSLGGFVCGAFASKDLFVIKQGGLLEDWMSKRASAETNRIDYFEIIVKLSEPSRPMTSVPIALLKLEYFRRFQLDVQLAFYREREKDHRREANKTLSYGGWAVLGATIATATAGVLGQLETSLAAIGALGAAFTGLSSFASMRESMNQDRRNAERYERTYQVLFDLNKRLSEVRKAVFLKGEGPLNEFVEAVHEQISLEHRQWIGELGEARGAFARLENTLKKLSSELPSTP